MNLKNILKIYTLERQLNPNDIALLETLRSLNDTERELLVESLSPGKKSTTKKVATKVTKSKRASELSDTLRQRATGKATATTTTDDDDHPDEHCQKEFPGGIVCDEPADANVHHLQTATGYHPFVSGVPSAIGKSSPNGEDNGSQVSSATPTENAGGVALEQRSSASC